MTCTQYRDRQNWLSGYWMIMTNTAWLNASQPILAAGLQALRKTKTTQARGKISAVIALIRERREQAARREAEMKKLMANQLSIFELNDRRLPTQDTQYEPVRRI